MKFFTSQTDIHTSAQPAEPEADYIDDYNSSEEEAAMAGEHSGGQSRALGMISGGGLLSIAAQKEFLLQQEKEKEAFVQLTTSGRQGPPAGHNSWIDFVKKSGASVAELDPADLHLDERIKKQQTRQNPKSEIEHEHIPTKKEKAFSFVEMLRDETANVMSLG